MLLTLLNIDRYTINVSRFEGTVLIWTHHYTNGECILPIVVRDFRIRDFRIRDFRIRDFIKVCNLRLKGSVREK